MSHTCSPSLTCPTACRRRSLPTRPRSPRPPPAAIEPAGHRRGPGVARGYRRHHRKDHRVVAVEQDGVLFGRKIVEEGAGGALGGGRDLLDRRLGVALRREQAQGLPLDCLFGLELLALSQPSTEWRDRVRHQAATPLSLTLSPAGRGDSCRAGRNNAIRIAPTIIIAPLTSMTSDIP